MELPATLPVPIKTTTQPSFVLERQNELACVKSTCELTEKTFDSQKSQIEIKLEDRTFLAT